MNANISAQNSMNEMKNILKKSAIFILIASAGLTVSGRAYMHHPPRFRHPAPPPPSAIYPVPPPPPAGHPAPPPAIYPYHMGGKWIAVGGISYLTGTIIRTCPEKPSVILIPQTVIVETSPQTPQTAVSVQQPQAQTCQTLQSELHADLAKKLEGIPYSIKINSFSKENSVFAANITAIVSFGGTNYNITSGGVNSSYQALKTYLEKEILNAVESIKKANPSATTIES